MAEADFPSNVSELPYSGDGDLARIKMQPHSVEAEQSVLGGLLLSADAWDSVAELVDPSDFYRPNHRLIFREIAKLAQAVDREGMTIVPISLYFNSRGIAKLKLAVAKGKKLHDKRETSKKRDWNREKARILRDRG